jgi:hypothetical protein
LEQRAPDQFSNPVTCTGDNATTLQDMPGGSTLTQLFAHRVIISGGYSVPVIPCTGQPIAWSASVVASNGRYAPGSAQAHAVIEACSFTTGECAFASTDANIRLKATRT